MAEKKEAITTSDKIQNSPWTNERIRALFPGMHKAKFYEKIRHNDWDDKEISILKKNHVIE